ncbi:unnamed protein product [Colias eurytheme]|nr:unnamed protein product [Colias eurytheme]
MKSLQVITLCSLVIISTTYGTPSSPNYNPIERIRPKVEAPFSDTDSPVEIKPIVMLPKSKLKFIVSETTTQQPLESLYKYYVGKKPVMRKFIPTEKVIEEKNAITHRPIMKQRKFFITPTSPKPAPSKEDLFSNVKRKMLNPIFSKKNSTAYKGSQSNDGDNYANYASSDMAVAGSRKVYRKIMGELPNKLKAKPNTVAVKEHTLKNTIPKVANNDSLKTQEETTIKTPEILETNSSVPIPHDLIVNETKDNLLDEANEKADKVEFIFVPPSTSPPPKEEKDKDTANEGDLQKGEEDLATESDQKEV